jgi:hypothetical protein
MKTYFHVLEHGLYGQIGYQTYFTTLKEAEKEVERLKRFFPELDFSIYPTNNRKQPEIVNK